MPNPTPANFNAAVYHVIQTHLDRAVGEKPHDIVSIAWDDVNCARLKGNTSEVYAAAEHYLYMRYCSGRDPLSFVAALAIFEPGITLWDAYKNLAYKHSLPTWKESEHDASKPSAEIRAWAFQGLYDGGKDIFGFLGFGSRPLAPTSPESRAIFMSQDKIFI